MTVTVKYVLQENYLEYSRFGDVVKGMQFIHSVSFSCLLFESCWVCLGQEKGVPKSKYEEDVYINNHTVEHVFCS